MQDKIVLQQTPHTKLNDYEILERLGNQKRRKFCDVFKVRHKTSSEIFILKVSINQLGKEALRSEAEFSFEMDSLPQVIGFIEDDESAALILKFKEGITLDRYFKKYKSKEQFKTVIQICERILPVFIELQKSTIAHLDIKPSNILVNETTGELHLIDFGLAINYSESIQRKLIFPLGYASPEVILNRLHLVNHQSDYFSFAVVLYQLFQGKLPLLNANPSITTNLQITHPLPEIDTLDKKASTAVQKLGSKFSFKVSPNKLSKEELDTSLQIGRNNRYNDFNEFIADFKAGGLNKRWGFF